MRHRKHGLIFLCWCTCLAGAGEPQVQSWSGSEAVETATALFNQIREKNTNASSRALGNWGGYTAAIAVRSADGVVEVHRDLADIFIVIEGEATLMTGGELINATGVNSAEVRATALDGAQKRIIRIGDVVHIPAGIPHQLLVKGRFAYYAIKVRTPDGSKH
jgi:mannose-6-phosphate isomerase-like protein (cupin superfamily)